ncbi:MAG: glycoside hydrolase family 2 TIM barrel-domain containing protein [Candidatus Omnitrophota bacterium]
MSKRNFLTISVFLGAIFLLTGMGKAPAAKKVAVKTLANGHYQLLVNNKPYIIKGVCYAPIPIGKSHDYDWWSDPSQPWKKDGELMKKMGVNTVRFYHPGENIEAVRKVIGDLYKLYGIRTIMGNWLSFWNYPAPFYDDPDFRTKVKKEALDMVTALKDEEGILFWVLGNENNYSFSGKVNPWSSDRIDGLGDARVCLLARAETYYKLVNEITEEIHNIDPQHPVAMGNGELVCLDVANEFAPAVDIIGCVIYRGKTFGNIFNSLKATFDKPIVFIEFGCDAYDAYQKKEDQGAQAMFLESQWSEIYKNLANNPNGTGNCLGGAMFEWTDEWWKHKEYDANAWAIHDTESNWSNGAYYFDIKAERNMNMNEEWFGIVGLQKAKEGNLDERVPRKAYYVIREFWKRPHDVQKNNKKKNGKKR